MSWTLVELTGLKGFEHRYPHQLSGGQRQRVAFARALAPEPQLLLLDEPFAAIDAKIRTELRTWLKEMIERVGITSIFVTHDQDEAIEVADEIMIINKGRLEQKGTPWDIYKNPQTPVRGELHRRIDDRSRSGAAEGLRGCGQTGRGPRRSSARNISRSASRTNSALHPRPCEGKVKHLHFRGSEWMVEVEVGDIKLITYRSLEKEVLTPGELSAC